MRGSWSRGSIVVAGFAATSAIAVPAVHADAPRGDPAFLGVGFQASQPGLEDVEISQVEDGTGAEVAGLLEHDVIVRLDGSLVDVHSFGPMIADHQSGDTVRLSLIRAGRMMTVDAVLSTRQEILRRRFVGRPAPVTALVDHDGRTYDLSMLRGHPSVIVWEPASCEHCESLLRRTSEWAQQRSDRDRAGAPMLLAVSTEMSTARQIGAMPFAVADPPTFESFAFSKADQERATFVVIDSGGQVAAVSSILASDDGAEAAVDDVLLACEQAEHRAPRR